MTLRDKFKEHALAEDFYSPRRLLALVRELVEEVRRENPYLNPHRRKGYEEACDKILEELEEEGAVNEQG